MTFDVFGTVVNSRTGIASEDERLAAEKGTEEIDWIRCADSWIGEYTLSMDRVRRGELPWTNIDGLAEEENEHLNRAWHRLTPWP